MGEMAASPIRIAVVDPYPMFRTGVVQTIAASDHFQIVAEGETAADARRVVRELAPDILLLDICLAENGFDAVRDISKIFPPCRIVVLTAVDDALSVSNALALGVKGYILKGVSGSELINALQTIHSGLPFLTPDLASRLLIDTRGGPLFRPLEAKPLERLTYREKQVLERLSKGMTNDEIAKNLGLNIKTIKSYITQVFRKLKVNNRVQALKIAQNVNGD
jgi:two-component system, NarL family, nitrate/nitrite response regulator NarL